jgi:type I restriction enzyme S subunit
MSELREGWAITTLDEASAKMVTGRRPKGGVRGIESGVLSLGGEHVSAVGQVDLSTPRFVPVEFVASIADARVAPNDVLIVKDGATTGKVAIADARFKNEEAYVNEHVFLCRIKDQVEPRLIYFFLRSDEGHDLILSDFRGAAQGGISREFSRKVILPLPPVLEQRRIVARIDSLTGKSKRARDYLDHIPRLVEKYKQAVLAAAFRGDLTREWRARNALIGPAPDFVIARQTYASATLGSKAKRRDEKTAQLLADDDLTKKIAATDLARPLPSGWCWTSIGSVFGVYVGATPSRKEPTYWNGDVPWVSSGEVAFCRIARTHETITEAGLENTSTRVHPQGTVLVGMIGEGKTRGQAAILDLPACNNQNCSAIRVSEAEYSAEYVYWYFWLVYEETRNIGAGNNQPALNKERVQRLLLPLAPRNEALEIARIISTAFAWIDRLASEVTSARRLIDRLDQAVLAKAFRGELVPQDPADEPASVLLARIRAGRAEAAPSRRRGRRRTGG